MSQQIVLVTGANGFLGHTTVLALLENGYKVRGTVRSLDSARAFKEAYPKYASKVEWVEVKDFTTPNAFNEALQGVWAIAHVASPFVTQNPGMDVHSFFPPAVDGSLNVLKAAQANATVKHVILISSIAAMVDFAKPPTHVFSEKDWNPITKEMALASGSPWVAYISSKKEAEAAAWNYFNSLSSPTFSFSTIIPSFIWGEAYQPTLKSFDGLNESLVVFWELLNGKHKDAIPTTTVPWAIGADECAQAQVGILHNPTIANGQRYLISQSHSYDWDDVLKIFYKLYPERKSLFPPPNAETTPPKWAFHNSKAKKDLGIEIEENLEVLVKRTADRLLELEKKFGA